MEQGLSLTLSMLFMKNRGKLQDLLIISLFFLVTFIFFAPLFSGKVLVQSDIQQHQGMAHEVEQYQKTEGKIVHWTNTMFSGMPTYLITDAIFRSQNLPQFVNYTIRKILPGVSALFFIGLVCYFIFMRAMQINRWLSAIGSFAFMAGSFVVVSLIAGHTSKINAYAYAPLILAGLVYIFRKRYWAGVFCLAYGLGAQIAVNHLQITFYTFLISLIFVVVYSIKILREEPKKLWQPLMLAALGVFLGLGVNYNKLVTIYKHSHYTIRGGQSELVDQQQEDKAQSADYDYATQWSYGHLETNTLIIPNFVGGASSEHLGKKSHWYNQQQLPLSLRENPPTYWGKLPFTSAPVYIGVVALALFAFGFAYSSNEMKWWASIASLLMIALAWGKYSFVYDLFYHYFPFFDKFRTPMMALLMLGITIPALGLSGVDHALTEKKGMQSKWGQLSFGIPLIYILVFGLLFVGFYSFSGAVDQQLLQAGLPKKLLDLLKDDRKMLLRQDTLRSLLFGLATAASFLFLYLKQKISSIQLIALIALLVFLDLFLVDKRYLNQKSYESETNYEAAFKPNEVERQILKDNTMYYRILNLNRNPFNDAITSYNFKSIGGYHAAKLQRYQDLIEYKLSKNDMPTLNMLNTKYIMQPDKEGRLTYMQNDQALGNAWFVDKVVIGQDAQDSFKQLGQINVANTAVVEPNHGLKPAMPEISDSTLQRSIKLSSYNPEYLTYASNVSGTSHQFAVFSDIFYQHNDGDGWRAFIDGQEVPVFQTNYVLRGIEIPAGQHTIDFKYIEKAFDSRTWVSRLFSGLILICGIGYFAQEALNNRRKNA